MTEGKLVFQAELTRRLAEDKFGDDSDDMHHVFRAKPDVDGRTIDSFIASFEGIGYNTVVYTSDFEHKPDEEIEALVRDLAPTVGLEVVEEDEP